MAASATFVGKVDMGNGNYVEYGTWIAGGDTTVTVTADATVQPEIQEILAYGMASDSDSAAYSLARDVNFNQLKLTFTNADTGDYWFIGKVA